jgi:transposase
LRWVGKANTVARMRAREACPPQRCSLTAKFGGARIEAPICRLKDFRRVATRYDKLAANFASAIALAAVIAFWCQAARPAS